MIRLLTEKDRLSVLEYLYQEPNFNIFPIGDIEAFGFNQDFQRIYGEFDSSGKYLSIFLRYRDNAIYYSHITRFNKDYLDIFKHDKFRYLSGKKDNLELLEPYFVDYEKRQMYFAEAKRFPFENNEQNYEIRVLQTEEDCLKLFNLLSLISEFPTSKQEEKDFVQNKMSSMKMGTTLFIEENGEMISTVATTAETTKSAMVVAVATKMGHRNKGLATILMQRLMQIYFEQKNKDLCLFYDNPSAGKIYKRLGFSDIGFWLMYEFKDEVVR
jgi:predicted GNAT family acetyltransferase